MGARLEENGGGPAKAKEKEPPVAGSARSALTVEQAQRLLDEFMRDRKHDERYASFDYCYGYFQAFRRENRPDTLDQGENLRRSCVELGFYLASWGMLRGSSDLLNKSVYFLRPLVSALAKTPPAVWNLDVDRYGEGTWELLSEERDRIIKALGPLRNRESDVLVTKIMMGVYGNVPAFDQYFKGGLGVSTFGPKAIGLVQSFYQSHRGWMDSRKIRLLTFDGKESEIIYSKAKLIDMICFMKGLKAGRE